MSTQGPGAAVHARPRHLAGVLTNCCGVVHQGLREGGVQQEKCLRPGCEDAGADCCPHRQNEWNPSPDSAEPFGQGPHFAGSGFYKETMLIATNLATPDEGFRRISGSELVVAVIPARDAELLDAIARRARFHVEQPGRAGFAFDDTAGAAQRGDDVLALDLGEARQCTR